MIGSVRLFIEGTLAVAIMVTLAVIAAFVAAAITGDRDLVTMTAALVFVLTGVVLAFRLWRMAKEPALPSGPDH
jgi:FtsH-binding integral membrane protein